MPAIPMSAFPLFPQKQTLGGPSATSVSCQPTFAFAPSADIDAALQGFSALDNAAATEAEGEPRKRSPRIPGSIIAPYAFAPSLVK
jgi:hypothetical protein